MKLHSDEQIETYVSGGAWGETTLLDQFSETVESVPERTAVIDPPNKPDLVGLEPERPTYAELSDAVDAVATALRERGIRKDDMIVVQLPNTWELAALYLAVARAGAIISPLPVQWRRHELEHVVDLTDAVAYIGPAEFDGFDHVSMAQEADLVDDVFSFADVREFTDGDADPDELARVDVGPNEVFNLHSSVTWTRVTSSCVLLRS
jgi:non-ribosomal peptide synthetase component E (peptide arylation enzyme)